MSDPDDHNDHDDHAHDETEHKTASLKHNDNNISSNKPSQSQKKKKKKMKKSNKSNSSKSSKNDEVGSPKLTKLLYIFKRILYIVPVVLFVIHLFLSIKVKSITSNPYTTNKVKKLKSYRNGLIINASIACVVHFIITLNLLAAKIPVILNVFNAIFFVANCVFSIFMFYSIYAFMIWNCVMIIWFGYLISRLWRKHNIFGNK